MLPSHLKLDYDRKCDKGKLQEKLIGWKEVIIHNWYIRVFYIDVIFLWEVTTNKKRLSLLTSSILQLLSKFEWIWVNFVCWLNTTFCEKKPYLKPRPSSINIIRTLLRRMEWFRSCLPNFVVVIRAQKPDQIQVVQMRSVHHTKKMNCQIDFLECQTDYIGVLTMG